MALLHGPSPTSHLPQFAITDSRPPLATQVTAGLESKELLQLCLSKLKPKMKNVQLTDAGFVWTEVSDDGWECDIRVLK